jgi:hypothetical protein
MRYLCCCLMLILSAPMLAQQREWRVSVEPTTAELPEEIRIQAAGSIGTTTLALWGANRREGRDSAISTLVFQMLRDSTALGSPVQAHSDEARPSRFCTVVPFEDRFLLLWNDRRTTAPGIYARWVDPAGGAMGNEYLIDTGAIVDPEGLRIFRTGSGVNMIRPGQRDSTHGLYLKRLSLDGAIIESGEWIGSGKLTDIIRMGELEDLTGIRADTIIRLLRADGSLDGRELPASRFAEAYHLAADSSMTIVKDTVLMVYRNLFDPMPERTLAVPALQGIPSRTVALTRDTSGGLAVTYSFIEKMGPGQSLAFIVKRFVVGDSAGTPVRLDSIFFMNYSLVHDSRTEINGTTVSRGCGNGIHVRNDFTFLTLDRSGYAFSIAPEWWSYSIDNNGEYARDAQATRPASCYSIDDNTEIELALRIRSKDTSTVRLFRTPGSSTVRASVARYRANVAQGTPNVFRRGDGLAMTWRQAIAATPTVMVEWSPLLDSMKVIATSSATGGHFPMLNTTAMISSEGYRYSDQSGVIYFTRSAVQLADTQWYEWGKHDYLSAAATIRSTEDPNRGESIAIIDFPVYYFPRFQRVLWIDGSGRTRRSASTSILYDIYLAYDSTAFIVGSRTGGEYSILRDTSRTAAFTLPPGNYSQSGLQRLYGPHIISMMPGDSSWDATLQMFSLTGRSEAINRKGGSRTCRTPVIRQSPIDSSIHIIWASDAGIMLSRFDRNLNIDFLDSVISSGPGKTNPAAIFRHDTLFVVWQDARNGASDIYATAWVARLLPARPPVAEPQPPPPTPHDTLATPQPSPLPEPIRVPVPRTTITAVTPNPANNIATFFVELVEPGDAVAEIRDMTGQVLIRREKSFDMDSGRWDIDIDDLTNGMYVLVVRAGGNVDMRKLLVVKR